MVNGGAAVGARCEEVEEEGAPSVRTCRRSRFVAQYRAYPLQSSFPVRVRGLSNTTNKTTRKTIAQRLEWQGAIRTCDSQLILVSK